MENLKSVEAVREYDIPSQRYLIDRGLYPSTRRVQEGVEEFQCHLPNGNTKIPGQLNLVYQDLRSKLQDRNPYPPPVKN